MLENPWSSELHTHGTGRWIGRDAASAAFILQGALLQLSPYFLQQHHGLMAHGDDAGFSRPTADDHRGWLWVVTILSIIYSATFFGARLFGKYGMLWWDDVVLGTSYVSE